MSAILLTTALPAEARPLLAHFGLKSLQHENVKIHAGNGVYLLQTGVGKINAAHSTELMLESFPAIKAVINAGIAGSDQPLGTVVLAHRVQDDTNARQWYPHLPPVRKLGGIKTLSIVSVDQPSENYTTDTAFDMEASGVFMAATRTLDSSFVHSIKVVSDNPDSSITAISAKTVSASMQSTIPAIEQLIAALPFNTLAPESAAHTMVQSLCTALHYTQTERHTVTQLLLRYETLIGTLPDEQQLCNMKSAKAVREKLTHDIENARVSY